MGLPRGAGRRDHGRRRDDRGGAGRGVHLVLPQARAAATRGRAAWRAHDRGAGGLVLGGAGVPGARARRGDRADRDGRGDRGGGARPQAWPVGGRRADGAARDGALAPAWRDGDEHRGRGRGRVAALEPALAG